MSVVRFLPSVCACGEPGYLKADLAEPADDFEPPHQDWRFHVVPNAAPVEPPARSERVAIHEAGHAVMAHVLGKSVAAITIEGQPHVAHADTTNNDPATTAMIALAGDHAERLLLQRLEYRPESLDVVATFEAVRKLEFGGCDRCTTALNVLGICGVKADDSVLLAAYRDVEARTISILREPRTNAAIRSLGAVLMRVGEICGTEAHKIIEAAGVQFGSRQTTERKVHA